LDTDGEWSLKLRIEYKWIVLALAVIVMFLQQGTRQSYGAVLPQIKSDFLGLGVTEVGLGMVGSVMSAVYAVAAVLMAFAADFFGRKKVIVTGLLFLAAGMFLCSRATALGTMVLGYGVLNAIGQSSLGPTASSLVAQYHVKSRATALSVFQGAVYLGIVFGAVGSGWLGGLGPGKWRAAFLSFAILCLFGASVNALALRDLPRSTVADRPRLRDAAMAMLGKPSAILHALAFGAFMFAGIGFGVWAPAFLQREFMATPTAAGLHATLWHMAGAFIGVAVGGRLSDRLAVKSPGARSEIAIVWLVLSMPFVVMAAYASSLPLCCLALALWGFSRGLYDANVYAAFYSVVVPRYWASAAGIFASFAFLMSSLAPVLLGWVGMTFSFRVAFAMLALFYLLGALLLSVQRIFFFARDHVKESAD